jgi:putative SOS response-associated peptidase YedK
MCGRFVVTRASGDLLPDLLDAFDPLRDDYNVAPTRDVALVRERDGERSMPAVHWGYVPGWAKDFKKQRPQPINARIETVSTSPMFRKSFATARAIIPAAGYYEWVVTETGKQPHFIHQPEAAIAMAGIVSAWPDPTKEEDDPDKWRLSMAIITRDAHVAPGEVHDRMPACLTPDAYDDWLGDHLPAEDLLKLLDRESLQVAHDLEHYEVTRDVNSVRKNRPDLVDPLPA